ncbi:hypothetical protein M3J09_011343 [Ascochyta lentis]
MPVVSVLALSHNVHVYTANLVSAFPNVNKMHWLIGGRLHAASHHVLTTILFETSLHVYVLYKTDISTLLEAVHVPLLIHDCTVKDAAHYCTLSHYSELAHRRCAYRKFNSEAGLPRADREATKRISHGGRLQPVHQDEAFRCRVRSDTECQACRVASRYQPHFSLTGSS